MKLFNWMQRRFHPTSVKGGLAKDEEFNNGNGDVLDGWKDGILAIGTLGLDPLKPFSQHSDYFILEEDDVGSIDEQLEHESFSVDTDDDDVNEVEPLIFTRFEHNYGEIGSNCEIMALNSDEFEVPRKEKAERITLAELFMEDSDKKKKQEFVEFAESNKIAKKQTKNGMSFANKFMPHFKDDSRPIKKIHQMVKRMLKRKIHPDVEGSKDDNISTGNEIISDSLSLLPTQLAIATGPTI